MLQELCKYIENNTALTLGTDLFCGPFPADASETDTASCVTEPPGYTKPWSSVRSEKHFQVLARGPDTLAARTASYVIYNALHIKGEVTLPEVNTGDSPVAEVINLSQTPGHIGKDATGRRELYSFNLVIHERTS